MKHFHTGEIVMHEEGVTRGPDVECTRVKFRACPDNKDWVFLGNHRVSEPDYMDDADCGWPLDKGEESPWIDVDNIDALSILARRAGDRVFYMLVKVISDW